MKKKNQNITVFFLVLEDSSLTRFSKIQFRKRNALPGNRTRGTRLILKYVQYYRSVHVHTCHVLDILEIIIIYLNFRYSSTTCSIYLFTFYLHTLFALAIRRARNLACEPACEHQHQHWNADQQLWTAAYVMLQNGRPPWDLYHIVSLLLFESRQAVARPASLQHALSPIFLRYNWSSEVAPYLGWLDTAAMPLSNYSAVLVTHRAPQTSHHSSIAPFPVYSSSLPFNYIPHSRVN